MLQSEPQDASKLLMISSYFREIKYNMKVLSQKAKCDQSDPGGHISENPAPYKKPDGRSSATSEVCGSASEISEARRFISSILALSCSISTSTSPRSKLQMSGSGQSGTKCPSFPQRKQVGGCFLAHLATSISMGTGQYFSFLH